MALTHFTTLGAPAKGEYYDRGSKFIAYGFRIDTEQDVKLRLEDIKQIERGARHFCYAYVLDDAGKIYRTQDDGEPSGTAGKPILQQIQGPDLSALMDVKKISIDYQFFTLKFS